MGSAHVPLVRLGHGIACPGYRICEQQPAVLRSLNWVICTLWAQKWRGFYLLVQAKRRDGRGLAVKGTGQSFLKR